MRFLSAFVSGLLSGAFLALCEGWILLRSSRLGFATPTADLFELELWYGLALGILGVLLALVFRKRTVATIAGATFGAGAAILAGWWVNKGILTDARIWEPGSLIASCGVLIAAALLAGLVAMLMRSQPRGGPLALAAVVLVVPALAPARVGDREAETRAKSTDRSRPDVTLIIIDTLRADGLSCYGNPRPTSPHLDALAARGARFVECLAQSSWTRPSMASLHSGTYPTSHGCADLRKVLPESAWTLAEALQSAGYVTGGFSANAGLTPGYGFAQGFDTFWNTDQQKLSRYSMFGRLHHMFMKRVMRLNPDNFYSDGETVTDQVIRWLGDGRASPTFTYVHYLDPHWPYGSAEYLLEGTPPRSYDYVQRQSIQARFPFEFLDPLPPEVLASEKTYYDADIRYCDRAIGRLLDHLKRIGSLDPNDVVIVSSDHGEQFYEHGSWGHGPSLFHEELNVPLILVGGGAPAGLVVPQPVQLIDVYPTILDLAGVPIPPDLQATSMKPLLTGEETEAKRAIYSERLAGNWPGKVVPGMDSPFNWETITSLQIGPRKLVEMHDLERKGEPFYMSFDRTTNPGERLAVATPKPGALLDRSDPAFTADPELLRIMRLLRQRATEHSLGPAPENHSRDVENALDEIGYGK